MIYIEKYNYYVGKTYLGQSNNFYSRKYSHSFANITMIIDFFSFSFLKKFYMILKNDFIVEINKKTIE